MCVNLLALLVVSFSMHKALSYLQYDMMSVLLFFFFFNIFVDLVGNFTEISWQ